MAEPLAGDEARKGCNMASTDINSERAQRFLDGLPFGALLGAVLGPVAPGRVEMSMPHGPDIALGKDLNVTHPGAITALIDTCAGAAVITHPDAGPVTATIDLRVDHLRTASANATVYATAECYAVAHSCLLYTSDAADD